MSTDVERFARSTAAGAARTWGSLTSRWRPLPDFLVIGAKRGGTTTLFRALETHPDVAPLFPAAQGKKSPHYFDLAYENGEQWYRSHFVADPLRWSGAGRRLTGEASPYYLFHPHAPTRIAAHVPDARLVVLLRNPADRAFSHHWDRMKVGVEDLSFADAIAAEPERLAGELQQMQRDPTYQSHAYEHFSYVARGEYAGQLQRLFECVPRQQVLVLRSEDLYAAPQESYQHTLDFLGLPPHSPTEFGKLHGHTDRPTVPSDARHHLDEHFAPHNAQLAELLGTGVWW